MVLHACNHEEKFAALEERIDDIEDCQGNQRAFNMQVSKDMGKLEGGQKVLLKAVFVIIGLLVTCMGLLVRLSI